MLSEGDRVPADGRLLTGDDLLIDESLLTGESVPVRKLADGPSGPARPGGDDLPFVFCGSLVVRGQGVAEISATGTRSEMGKIGTILRDIESVSPRLTVQTRYLVRIAAIGGLIVSSAAVLLYGTMRGNWLEAILGGIAIGMSMLPEEFPLVLTVFMVMGAWRISRARVLTRRAAAIETLGSATVLCTDKTGTLTENRMTVVELRADGQVHRLSAADIGSLPAQFASLVECGVLASAIEPFDPMEVAFHSLERATRVDRPHPHEGRILSRAWGLRPELLAVTQAWQSSDADSHVIAMKGAPEAVARLCRFDTTTMARLRQDVDAMAAQGHARARRGAHPGFRTILAGLADRPDFHVPGFGRPGGSVAGRGAGSSCGMPCRRHSGGHDHGRLSGHGNGHCPSGGTRFGRRDDGRGNRQIERYRPCRGRSHKFGIRPHSAGAEAAHRPGVQSEWRSRWHDR
jgi:Ca2+-transporting ATPase